MNENPLPDHLSVSAIQLYRRCPLAWKRRYLDGAEEPASPPMAFGKAVALALEAHHNGQDGEVAFVRAHSAARIAMPGAEFGLRLLALYRQRFNLDGRPERPFSLYLPDRHRVPVPIVGVMDLERDREVVEFKTSRNPWTQARVDAQYQAAAYNWAFEQRHGRPPDRVRYVVFSTRRVEVQEILTRPTTSDFAQFELAAIAVWRGLTSSEFAGCGRCTLCRPPSEGYVWWPAARMTLTVGQSPVTDKMPTSSVDADAPSNRLRVAPSGHHAYWSQPAWSERTKRPRADRRNTLD